MRVETIALNKVFADFDWNTRRDFGTPSQQKDFRESLEKTGQMTPMIATIAAIAAGKEGAGLPLVLAGYRRYKEMVALGWKEAAFSLVDVVPYSLEARVWNVKENYERESLSTFETAKMILTFAETYKLSDKEISEKIRGSRELHYKTVNNLRLNFLALAPDILMAWEKRHPVCRTDMLNLLRTMPHEEQIARFAAMCGEHNLPLDGAEATRVMADRGQKKLSREPKAPGAEGEEKGETAKKRPDSVITRYVLNLANESELAASTKQAVVRALNWSLGETEDLVIGNTLIYSFSAMKAQQEKDKKAKAENAKLETLAQKVGKMSDAEKRALLAALTAAK